MPRRTVAAAIGASAMLAGVPAAHAADKPSPKLKKSYAKAYKQADKQGHEPGRNILKQGVRKKGKKRDATARELRRSIGILHRMVRVPGAPATAAAPSGAAAAAASGGSTAPAHLQAIAACESGGNPQAVSSSGQYRGKYQFDMQTWQSVGGSGDPAAASEAEQDARAQALMAQRGSSPWPVCG